MDSTPYVADAISQNSSIFNVLDSILLIIILFLVIYIIFLHKEKVKNQKQIIRLEKLILEECNIIKKCQKEKENPFIDDNRIARKEKKALSSLTLLQKQLYEIDDFLN